MKRSKLYSKHTKPAKPKPRLLSQDIESEPGEPNWTFEDINDPNSFTVIVMSSIGRFMFDLTDGDIYYELPLEKQLEQNTAIRFTSFKINTLTKANSLLADVYLALSDCRIKHTDHIKAMIFMAEQWLLEEEKKQRFSAVAKYVLQKRLTIQGLSQADKEVIKTPNGYITKRAQEITTPKSQKATG